MSKLYNLEYLEEISSGDKGFIVEMLDDFIKNTPKAVNEIEEQVNSSDWPQLYKTVHKFIPSFDFVGAASIRDDLRNLELYSKTQSNLEQIKPLVSNIKLFCNDIILEIKSDFNL